MDITTLVNLTSRAWSLNILAALHHGTPGRQAPLLAATSASRTSFANSLEHLFQLKLLERNPGHGHPLRPEFRLTPLGREAAETAAKIVSLVPDEEEFSLLRRSWTLPVLAVTAKPRRFSEIKSGLGRITDRALSQSLGQLEAQNWVSRSVDLSQKPLRPAYQAINQGWAISQTAGLL